MDTYYITGPSLVCSEKNFSSRLQIVNILSQLHMPEQSE